MPTPPSIFFKLCALTVCGCSSFVVLTQALTKFRADEIARKDAGTVCTRCSQGERCFAPGTIICDGECNGSKIRVDARYFELSGETDTHYCEVRQ